MQLVIPMAGLGKRFSDAGYTLPKPLVPIDGVPMVVRAVRELPPASRIVFVCHPDHVAKYGIDRELKRVFPCCHVVVTPGLTAGQACSVRLAVDELDPDEPVLVGACDNSHLYSDDAWCHLISDPAVEAVIWTYRRDPRVLVKPTAHGWVDADPTGLVRRVSVKVPLSPAILADHAVSGTFWFRTARLMARGIDDLVASGQRVNNEFYLDSVPNILIATNHETRVFEVDRYIGWGTPEDLEDFQRWERYFQRSARPAA
jgi:NDP-sugar pyrophosphorylase family protein